MSTTNVIEGNETQVSIGEEHLRSRVFTMFYRHGANPQCTKNFEFIGNFRDAMDRARKHCEIMNYRFILLRPHISDLELDEKNRSNGINS